MRQALCLLSQFVLSAVRALSLVLGSHGDMHAQLLYRPLWCTNATAEAMRIVRNVIYSNPKPLTIQEVYAQALQVSSTVPVKHPVKDAQVRGARTQLEGPPPPHPEHPIRSMRCDLSTLVSQCLYSDVHLVISRRRSFQH